MNQSACLVSFQKRDNKHLQLLDFAKEVKIEDNARRYWSKNIFWRVI
jgi:CRISPR-associated protein Cas1